jgi:hypothetical protein
LTRQVGTRKTFQKAPGRGVRGWACAVEASLAQFEVASKRGVWLFSRDEPGGCPDYWPGGARREGGVSLVCGSGTEREKASVDTAIGVAGLQGRERGAAQQGPELHRLLACDQSRGAQDQKRPAPRTADPPAHRPVVGRPGEMAEPHHRRMDPLLRPVLPNRARSPPAARQRLPEALGREEIQAAVGPTSASTSGGPDCSQGSPVCSPTGARFARTTADQKSPVTGDCHAGICGSRGLRCPRPPDSTSHGRPVRSPHHARIRLAKRQRSARRSRRVELVRSERLACASLDDRSLVMSERGRRRSSGWRWCCGARLSGGGWRASCRR